HLHGCTDRVNGREVFYSNPAVRRTGESARGSFIATGIQSSFPVAHSRVASSPVNFAWSVRDGVGRVVVEDTDRTSGMTWRDEFILRGSSSVLEQRVTLYNGSLSRRGYHWWANAAIELDDPQLRIVYPVKWMLPHGDGPMTPWPINESGVDLSHIENHKVPLGLFAHGSREPWMAIYKPKFRSGIAHYANADQVKGKKIWVWGNLDKYVLENLTEKFNSYVEMQAGEFETQPEFEFLLPEESKTFSHYWIAFRDLGGISRTTLDVVLNLSRSGKSVTVELNATHPVRGATIRLAAGGKTIFEERADFDPRTKYAKTLDAAPSKLTVDVVDAGGKVLLHHIEGEYDSTPFDKNAKNPEPTKPGDSDSEDATLARGAYEEQRDEWPSAWDDYQAGLKRTPGSTKLTLAAGRTAFTLNRYDDAIRLLGRLAEGSAEAAWYYGAALASKSNRVPEAKAALSRATKDPAYARAARLESALLTAREQGESGQAEAVRMLKNLAAEPGASPRIGAFEVAMLRRAGQMEEARKRLAFWLAEDPANDVLRAERSFLRSADDATATADDASLWRHLGGDPERVLNVAEAYRQLGDWSTAIRVLERSYPEVPSTEREPGSVLPQDNPLVAYYRGFCRLQLSQSPGPDFKTASTLSTRYVFPHREIYFRVLGAAVAQDSRDAVAHALLGDLYFDSLQTDQAIAEWRKAWALKRTLPALTRNLGRALLDVAGNRAMAAQVLLEGRRTDPENSDIAQALARLNAPEPKADANRKPDPVAAVSKANAATDLRVEAPKGDLAERALARSATDPEGAAALFNTDNFPQEKQPDGVRRAYIEVQLQRLLALAHGRKCEEVLARLEKLGDNDAGLAFTLYGFGSFMKPAHFQFYTALIESKCANEKAAQKRWRKLSKLSAAADSAEYAFPYLAAKRLGDADAMPKIEAAILAVKKSAGEHATPVQLFTQGALLLGIGKRDEGEALLQKALQDGDPWVQYLCLTEMVEASRR
ncbi:MAG: DUF5107 domain-containing protein, partial [Bryobacteraceae bacterium]